MQANKLTYFTFSVGSIFSVSENKRMAIKNCNEEDHDQSEEECFTFETLILDEHLNFFWLSVDRVYTYFSENFCYGLFVLICCF